ncbi:HAD family hydrolase [Mycoplasma marinum]|uniref:Cof-type HAD-IIB family hydrolase n=1 Tax=Mycoplasma marinum TaxID=1937190 RepID=A0A4R0XPU8_9MOLU|nr:HAD family hydrolase [Mycoplasma marinum]TCG10905.1 hypothetical protein C4B24_03535 [Mycoplasma marinum]
MKIKAFAFDMDGTLLPASDSSSPHPETVKALREAHKAGYKLILATGRPFVHTLPTALEIGCVSYMVSNNGSNVYDLEHKKFLNHNSIDIEIFNRVFEVAKETNSFFALHTKKNVYRHYFFDQKNKPSWLDTSVHENIKDETIEQVKQFAIDEDITQLSLKNSEEVIAKWQEKLSKEMKEVSIHVANEVYLDVNPLNTSKLTGLELVAQNEDFTTEQIMAFGDSGNDIQMVGGVGYGVAMGNSNENLKTIADEVIGHHSTDTIGKKIREVISCSNK